ncbi:MAG: peptidylprolyl isomerase [Gemmataceae bacterium]
MVKRSSIARLMGFQVVWIVMIAIVGCGGSGANEGEGRPDVTTRIPGAGKNEEVGELKKSPKELQQSFEEATIPASPSQHILPQKTFAGKSVGEMYVKIAGEDNAGGLWKEVKLVSSDGNLIRYTATITTNKGTMKMKLLSEFAPNHVRNFVCLAKAGYYDGLRFDRSVSQSVGGSTLKYIEGGCPLGEGWAESGSIGYCMRPETNSTTKFGPGMVAASHGPEVESAACKFFINLARTPEIDGQYTIFGQITEGLSVAQEIQQQPTDKNASVPAKLVTPVVIEKVTIESVETGIVVKA